MSWTMGGYYKLALLVGVASLLSTSRCDVSCKGTDGRSGEAGAPGRDGWPGAKGEKGEPAVMVDGPVDASVLLRLKGEMGSRGLQGAIGPKGYRGNLGAAGFPGSPGLPGPDGKSAGQGSSQREAKSAFSVIRTVNIYPPFNQIITYQETVVNKPGDFNAETGHFTCRVPGVYYFTFQAMARVSLCLRIVSDSRPEGLGFCDYSGHRNPEQVLSGGVVLQLTEGQRVWLESFRDNQNANDLRDTRDKQIFFSGFLLFSDSA